MSWYDQTTCPICKSQGFLPDCDEVGMLEGNLHGLCTACGQVAKCECGDFIAEGQEHTCLPDLL